MSDISTARTLPPINIYSLAHAFGVLPRAHHHCHSTRRGARPSNCALSNDKPHAASLTSPMALHIPQYISEWKAIECRVVIVTAPVTKRDQVNCALSNNERHHDCQNSPPLYIPHKIPMYENVMLSNVAASLSQRSSGNATK